MADVKERPSNETRRKLTDEEKVRIRSAIRQKYGNQKLLTPALLFRLGSMLLIILFSIGIIINLKRRAQQVDRSPRKARVVISIEAEDRDGAIERESVRMPDSPTSSK